MKNYLVFINNLFADHEYMYSISDYSEKNVEDKVWKAFEKEFSPDEKEDWQISIFEVNFSAQPQYVIRVDRET